MFSRFFNLKENPFSEIADVRRFFSGRTHMTTLNAILANLNSGKGLVLVSGEVGTGKTLMCKVANALLHHSGAKTAIILQPLLEGEELVAQLIQEFGVTPTPSATPSMKSHLDQLNQFFLNNAQQDVSSFLLIDEAHKLSFEALETIRLLTNLESRTNKLVQVVLFAQSELEKKLLAPDMRQIRQRLSGQITLAPLPAGEVEFYLRHRIAYAGGENYVRFDENAVKAIYKKSQGLPRLINFYAELALRNAEAHAQRLIRAHLVNAKSHPTWKSSRWGRIFHPGSW